MQFVVTAYDGKDEGAYERRMSIRPQHLENMSKLNENGHVICAGGMTNSEGKLIGSVLIMEYESREQLDDYLANEPYVVAGVWQKIEVDTMNVVLVNGEKRDNQ